MLIFVIKTLNHSRHGSSTSASIDKFSWLIDTRATDLIISSLNIFASYKTVTNLLINLPNGQNVSVAYVDTVHLTPSLS